MPFRAVDTDTPFVWGFLIYYKALNSLYYYTDGRRGAFLIIRTEIL
jgi:hypothetical protein